MFSPEVHRIASPRAHYFSNGWEILRRCMLLLTGFLWWTFSRHNKAIFNHDTGSNEEYTLSLVQHVSWKISFPLGTKNSATFP